MTRQRFQEGQRVFIDGLVEAEVTMHWETTGRWPRKHVYDVKCFGEWDGQQYTSIPESWLKAKPAEKRKATA